MTHSKRLLPEWHPQEAIILAWPDESTDWLPWLEEVQATYLKLIQAINRSGSAVVLLVKPTSVKSVEKSLPVHNKVMIVPADFNDTWVRDYAFLTLSDGHHMFPIEYQFNGWGGKFNAELDNQVNKIYLAEICKHSLTSFDLFCEGGALEIDQHGHLLSTELCLTNTQRNGAKSLDEYKLDFATQLNVSKTTIFKSGYLQGDDTDGHIDTLVRFTPNDGLVVQSCYNRREDPHFGSLEALLNECHTAFPNHHIFELPLPYITNSKSERLPASYANFLINNNQVLCPIYQQAEDDLALKILQRAYSRYEIVPIDCLSLVQQFGSLHCISMQVPVGTFKAQVLERFQQGVTIYA